MSVGVVFDVKARQPELPPRRSEHGEVFRSLRKTAGMTQQDAATVLGIGRTSVTNMEAGRQPINLTHLEALADALGADVVVYVVQRRKVNR